MFTKLNAWLITRFPLLWNTRVVFVLPLVLLIHGLFYLAGYSQKVDFSDLKNSRFFNAEEVILFSCLITVVILLIWMVHYLRNNPLKAHYPIKKAYMFGEFMLLFLVFFSSATFFFTYRQGLYDQTKGFTDSADLVEEANTINLAYHFIPLETDNFRPFRSCDSLKARKERGQARLLLYNLAVKQGKASHTEYMENEPEPNLDSIPPSYLYYCRLMIHTLDTGTPASSEENSRRVVNWLKTGRKDSVLHALNRLKVLLIKYDIGHVFDPLSRTDSVFAYPDFYVGSDYFSKYSEYEEPMPTDSKQVSQFIENDDLTDSISMIERVRKGFWQYEILLIMLYYAMGAAIVLYSFRMMKARIWFAALIGVGLWTILLGLFFTLANIRDVGSGYVMLILYVAFLVSALILIRNKAARRISGLTYLWAIWLQLAVVPIVIGIILDSYYKYSQYEREPGVWVDVPKPHFQTWIYENVNWVSTGNLVLFLILLIVIYIPLARKWQANPEE